MYIEQKYMAQFVPNITHLSHGVSGFKFTIFGLKKVKMCQKTQKTHKKSLFELVKTFANFEDQYYGQNDLFCALSKLIS